MINYDGRRFSPAGTGNDPNAPIGVYHQSGDLVWAEFAGGEVRRGSLCGLCADDSTLEFAYTMVLADGQVISGRCVSTAELREDGRVYLHEKWERYGAHAISGVSELEQV